MLVRRSSNMFKFSKTLFSISSNQAFLLVISITFLLINHTASTSDIRSESETQIPSSHRSTIQIKKVAGLITGNDTRKRTGRLFNHKLSQQLIDNGSFNSLPTSSSISRDDIQQKYLSSTPTEHANDGSSFASFGDIPSISSTARQFTPSSSDYLTQPSYHTSHTSNSQANSPYHPYHPHYNPPETQKPPGYPTNAGYLPDHRQSVGQYDSRVYLNEPPYSPWTAGSTSSGLMSSASHALSHWTGSFGIAEIICSLVVLAIGAIILAAPFFLIYLVLMGNFSGSGQISLANPTQATTPTGSTTVNANGRRKRSIQDLNSTIVNSMAKGLKIAGLNQGTLLSAIKHLDPTVNPQQLNDILKRLTNSFESLSNLKKRLDSN